MARFVLAVGAVAVLGSEPTLAQMVDAALRLDTDTSPEGTEDVDVVPAPRRVAMPIEEDTRPPRNRRAIADAYAPKGLDAGGLVLLPSLKMGTVITSNVRKTPTGEEADVGLRLSPKLEIQSDWQRHSVKASAEIDFEQFHANEELKTVTGALVGQLRLDVRRTTQVDVDLSYAATSTGLRASTLPATASSYRLDQSLRLGGSITHDFGGLNGTLRAGVVRNVYGDVQLSSGGTESNDDRDYNEFEVAARLGLDTGGKVQPYAEAAYVPRFHDVDLDRNGSNRDSQGLRLKAGLSVEDGPLWTADLAATMELRDYSDSSLGTVLSPGIASAITWRPTDLTQFEFNSGVGLTETVAAGIAANKSWTLGAKVSHSLRDNVVLSSGVNANFEHVAGETDITTTGTLGFEWTLNPAVVLSAGYEGTFFHGGATADYADHRLVTSITLRK